MKPGDRVELRGLETVRHWPRTITVRGKELAVWEYEFCGPDHRLYYYSGVRLFMTIPDRLDLLATVDRLWGNGHNVRIKRPRKLEPKLDQMVMI